MAKRAEANRTAEVDAFMAALDHPFKAGVQAVREAIKAVDPGITEQVKWNAPSFSYKGYLMTFNLHAKDRIHLVWHNGAILADSHGILEGDYPDRRMTYLSGDAEAAAKRDAIQDLVAQWITAMDKATST